MDRLHACGRKSDMTRNAILGLLLAGALVFTALPATAGQESSFRAGPQDQLVTCESRDGREHFCPAAIGNSARVVRELGTVPCIEDETWRWNPQGIYVRRGCRAQFAFRPGGGNSGGGGWGNAGGRPVAISCGSAQQNSSFCPAPNDGRVSLVANNGRAQCIDGYTWRADQSGIFVRNGCIGRFSYYPLNSNGGGWGPPPGGWNPAQPFELVCESRSHRWASCPANIHGSVQIVRQISNAPCIRNQTWGQIRNEAIWVSNGCRARFQISGTRSAQPMTSGDGMAPPGVKISPR
jgi:hypothetical protein